MLCFLKMQEVAVIDSERRNDKLTLMFKYMHFDNDEIDLYLPKNTVGNNYNTRSRQDFTFTKPPLPA